MSSEEVSFSINDKIYKICGLRSDLSLNTFIREVAKLPGTKFMCKEGGCGACVVTIKRNNPCTSKEEILSVNSCLTLVSSCKDYEITTIEGIGDWKKGYHPIQKVLADSNGSQCGFCSPGMVMNMYSALEKGKKRLTRDEIERSFDGNICRCTGYRPILEGFKSFAEDSVDLEDIEELPPKCCKEVCRIAGDQSSRMVYPKAPNDFFDIISQKNLSYRIVAGNTASGVYKKPELSDFSILIDVTKIADLQAYEITNHLMIGGAVTLTKCIEILQEATKTRHLEYLEKFAQHVKRMATVAVRNVGTLAGNLMVKHAHNEFPSDLYVLLAGVGARINVMINKKFARSLTCEEFLEFPMDGCLLSSLTIPSYFAEEIHFETYKIMPRAQNAHAMVNAAFLLKMRDEGTIESASLVFGNISPTFVHASATERFLQNKALPEKDDLLEAIKCLQSEIRPVHNPPEPSPEYRNKLACGLFYKFILSILKPENVDVRYQSGALKLYNQRGVSSGSQNFPTNSSKYPLTKPVRKIEALEQCSGEAKYSNDIPPLSCEVHCALVIATEVGRQIEHIDCTEALKIPGVIRFISKDDIPGRNDFIVPFFFPNNMGEVLFVDSVVRYHGQPCGVIAAETAELASRAAEMVEIYYCNPPNTLSSITKYFRTPPQPKVRTFDDVIRENQSNFKNVEGSINGIINLGGQYHFSMEPQTTVCIPNGNGMEVYCSTQWMNLVQAAIAQVLAVSQSSIQVKVFRLGGSFGAKVSRPSMIACACALVCHLLNRPARFVQSLKSMMVSLGKRLGLHSEYQVLVDNNGKITRLTNNFLMDFGWCTNELALVEAAKEGISTCYDDRNWTYSAKPVTTDAAKNTFTRCPGTMEAHAMCEKIMEHIAHALKRDPIDVRLVNMPEDSYMKTLLPKFLSDISYYARKKEIEAFNSSNKWMKKGLGVSCMKYPMSAIIKGPLIATVTIYVGDGSVAISHSGIECGQGLNTKVAQVASSILKVPLDLIKITPSNSVNGANSMMSAKSMGSEMVSCATKKACETLMSRLSILNDEKDWVKKLQKAYEKNISLIATESCTPPDSRPYSVWGCACSEILLDVITGEVAVKRSDLLEDVGASISPYIDVGQVEGAFIMGLGYFLTENLVYDMQTGKILTYSTWNYHVPGAKDIPEEFHVVLTQSGKAGGEAGLLGSKGTGEPALCLALSVPIAIEYAINAAREDLKRPRVFHNLGTPLSPEKVLQAISADPEKMYDTGKCDE